MGSDQYIKIKKSLKKVQLNPQGWLWRVQDLSGRSDWRCGNSKRPRTRRGAWRWHWVAEFHDKTLPGKELLLMDEKKKKKKERERERERERKVYWDGIYNALKIALSTTKDLQYDINVVDKAQVGEDWLQFWKKFYCG